MKKLLLIIAALFTIVGCTKTEVVLADAETQEIGLMAINQNSVKATGPIDGGSLPTNDAETMTIWGFYANDGSDYKLTTPYMNGVTYKYQDASWKGWKDGAHKPYYWPSTGSMKFLAVYPSSYPHSSGGNISYTYDDNDDKAKINITNVDLSAFHLQKDIMYSSSSFTTPLGCPQQNAQDLTFEHLLAQVVVAVKPTVKDVITITNVSLVNAYLTGDIAITHEGSTITYSYPNTTTSILGYPLVAALENTAITNTDSYTQVSANGALVIPSELDTRKLRITYTIDGGADITHDIDVTGSWEKGKKYIYNVTINLQEIKFDTVVTPWDSQTPVTPSI